MLVYQRVTVACRFSACVVDTSCGARTLMNQSKQHRAYGLLYGLILRRSDSHQIGASINAGTLKWMVMQNPIKMDDLGVPPF